MQHCGSPSLSIPRASLPFHRRGRALSPPPSTIHQHFPPKYYGVISTDMIYNIRVVRSPEAQGWLSGAPPHALALEPHFERMRADNQPAETKQ